VKIQPQWVVTSGKQTTTTNNGIVTVHLNFARLANWICPQIADSIDGFQTWRVTANWSMLCKQSLTANSGWSFGCISDTRLTVTVKCDEIGGSHEATTEICNRLNLQNLG